MDTLTLLLQTTGPHSPITTTMTMAMQKSKKGEKTSTMILDLGATSHFVNPKENLSITGKSNKTVTLPDGSTIAAIHTTEFSFTELTNDA